MKPKLLARRRGRGSTDTACARVRHHRAPRQEGKDLRAQRSESASGVARPVPQRVPTAPKSSSMPSDGCAVEWLCFARGFFIGDCAAIERERPIAALRMTGMRDDDIGRFSGNTPPRKTVTGSLLWNPAVTIAVRSSPLHPGPRKGSNELLLQHEEDEQHRQNRRDGTRHDERRTEPTTFIHVPREAERDGES